MIAKLLKLGSKGDHKCFKRMGSNDKRFHQYEFSEEDNETTAHLFSFIPPLGRGKGRPTSRRVELKRV